jgi:hypothetical protein
MGAEDNGPNLEELTRRMEALERENQELREARRMEALERENRELREELGSSASKHEFGTPQQQPQATQAKEMTDASSKTVGGLLLGPRNKQAYSRPLVGVLPSYVVGLVVTCAVAGYGGFYALWGPSPPMRWLGLIAALFFGVYAGIRDGREFVFGRFQYVGLITAIGVTVVAFLASFWAVSNWPEGTYTGPTPMAWLLRHLIWEYLRREDTAEQRRRWVCECLEREGTGLVGLRRDGARCPHRTYRHPDWPLMISLLFLL